MSAGPGTNRDASVLEGALERVTYTNPGSGMIKGIGPVMAERMVKHFGVDIMHMIDDSPGRLIEVDGLGPKRTAKITAAWAEQKAILEVMVFL
jgi:exodeoxyribonuclease V alpha subunit